MKEILLAVFEGMPKRVDMDVKRLGFLHWGVIHPHIDFVRRQVLSPTAVAFSMSATRGNAKALRDFVEVWNGSKNSQSGAVLEINLFFLPFATGTVWRCVDTFVVAYFDHTSSDDYAALRYTCAFYSLRIAWIRNFSKLECQWTISRLTGKVGSKTLAPRPTQSHEQPQGGGVHEKERKT